MSNSLALDSSDQLCTVALCVDGTVTHRQQASPQSHGQHILAMIDALLSEAQLTVQDLDRILVSQGPGSLTGVRVALAVAYALSYAHAIPLLGITSCELMVQQASLRRATPRIAVAHDMRMGDVACVHYVRRHDGWHVEKPLTLMRKDALEVLDDQEVLRVGNGWPLEASEQVMLDVLPHAKHAFAWAEQQGLHTEEPVLPEPIYLRGAV